MTPVRRTAVLSACIVGVLGVGFLDVVTGPIIDLSVLYLIPITIATGLVGLVAGLVGVVIASVLEVGPLLSAGSFPASLVLLDGLTHLVVRAAIVVALDRVLRQFDEIRHLRAQRDFDLELAAEAHKALFLAPRTARSDLDIGQRVEPIREIGGDYSHFADTARGFFFCVADIAGKGVSAALFTSALAQAIADALRLSPEVEGILESVNARLAEVLPSDRFVTLFAAMIDDDGITYANAGHEPPLLYRDGDTRRVGRLDGAHMPPLGIQARVKVECAHTSFSADDVLLVVTDGVTESVPFFGCAASKLPKLLGDSAPFGVNRVVDSVFDACHEDGALPRDDIIVVAIQRRRQLESDGG